MPFTSLGLSQPILRALHHEGYTVPTPIQRQTIPHALAGRDLLGIAQTGTGKTAASALPILHRLAASTDKSRRGPRKARALILAPTRDPAAQPPRPHAPAPPLPRTHPPRAPPPRPPAPPRPRQGPLQPPPRRGPQDRPGRLHGRRPRQADPPRAPPRRGSQSDHPRPRLHP